MQGQLNNADGNCAFEAVINNINKRNCFPNKLPLTPLTYRVKWMTDLQNQEEKYPELGAGFTEEEKKENWEKLKQSGTYEVEFFGDFVIYGIASGCQKNILIFNTSSTAHCPIYVIDPKKFGGEINSDIPVVLAYNGSHYESLHPVSEEDVERTKHLVKSYLDGSYN